MKKGGTRYSPAFKFQVVLEAPEGRGERDRGPSGPGLRGAPACVGQWKERMKDRHASSITHHA